ncbi:MAG: DNA polymerase III subunit chi, partial [Pseudomonadota bacterium]|nr:DNA polymerase III subunit chi [Pseudomonadota bacterium]
ILITHNKETINKSDVLIDLSEIEVDECNKFERIIEIVLNQEDSKKKARKRFVEFRDLGYKVKSHQI